MSEYQFLAFRAVDSPLTDRDFVYARKQSSRAKTTRWCFENEYHVGDFHGDADGWVVQTVLRPVHVKGFVVLPK